MVVLFVHARAMDKGYIDARARLNKHLPVSELFDILNTYPALCTQALDAIDCAPPDPALLRALFGDERALDRAQIPLKFVESAPLVALARYASQGRQVGADIAPVFFTKVLERLRHSPGVSGDGYAHQTHDVKIRARAVLAGISGARGLSPSRPQIAMGLGVVNPKRKHSRSDARNSAVRALRLARNAEDCDGIHSKQSSCSLTQWSDGMDFPLNMLMAMFGVRPEFILDRVPTQLVVNAIIEEFQNGEAQVMSKQKTIFLFLASLQLVSGVIQLRDLPALSWNSESMYVAEQFNSELQRYLKPVILPSSTMVIPDYVALFARIFEIAAKADDSRLIELTGVILQDIPSVILRRVLMSFFSSDDATIPFLQSVCKLVETLSSESSELRNAFLRLMSLHDCFILFLLKAVDCSDAQSIVDMLCNLCDIGIDMAKDTPGDDGRDTVLRTIENVLAWISVRFRSQAELAWCAVWKKLGSTRKRCKTAGRGMHICKCMAVEIVESTHRKYIIGKCSCRRTSYHKALLPSLERWCFWECLTATYLETDTKVAEMDAKMPWCHVLALENQPEWVSVFRGSIRCCLSTSIHGTGSNNRFISEDIRCVSYLLARKSWSRPVNTIFTILEEELSYASRMWGMGEIDQVELLRRHGTTLRHCIEQLLATLPRRLRFPESVAKAELENANWIVPLFFREIEQIQNCSNSCPCLAEYAGHVSVLGNSNIDEQVVLLKLLGTLASAKLPRKVIMQTKPERDLLKARMMEIFRRYEQ